MARKVFFSFEYKPDNWRASKVRQIGAIEGNQPAKDNDWEKVTDGGDAAIERWISNQMSGRTCTVVLIGKSTKGRKWINYEIEKSWNDGKGLVGINIHNITDVNENQTAKGANPFYGFKIGDTQLSSIVKVYDPPYKISSNVYKHIADNIEEWIEEAIEIRNSN